MNLPIHKLQVHKLVSIKFACIKVSKCFPQQISKQIHIYKWISFAISIFFLVKEMASVTTFDQEVTANWKTYQLNYLPERGYL